VSPSRPGHRLKGRQLLEPRCAYAFRVEDLFPPGSREAVGALRYLNLRHELARPRSARAPRDYKGRSSPTSGTDEVLRAQRWRFLADNVRLTSSCPPLRRRSPAGYREHVCSGEGATVAPLTGRAIRAHVLAPNSVSNGRIPGDHCVDPSSTVRDARTEPSGSSWRAQLPVAGRCPARISVRAAPTSFGPLVHPNQKARGDPGYGDVPSRCADPEALASAELPTRKAHTVKLDGARTTDQSRLRD